MSQVVSAQGRWPARTVKGVLRTIVPLRLRKRIAVWISRQSWLSARDWWSVELLRDFAEADADAYHRFLWSHHMAYARTYEVPLRFGEGRVHATRRLLFELLEQGLREQAVDPTRDVRAVLEVGCSMGYLLRFVETRVFPGVEVLHGVDIDRYAVERGRALLRREGSKAILHVADMADLPKLDLPSTFDVVMCLGVLMYLTEDAAATVVAAMLEIASGVVAIAGLAHPRVDNRDMACSEQRARDGAWIHNVDAMVRRAGGEVWFRRWDGAQVVDGNTVYFVFCRRAEAAAGAGTAVGAAG